MLQSLKGGFSIKITAESSCLSMAVTQMEGLKILKWEVQIPCFGLMLLLLLHITQHVKDVLSSAAAIKMQVHLQAHEHWH